MLIYLHGLNSSSRSHKAGILRERLAPIAVAAPDYPAHRPERAVASLTGFLRELQVGNRGERQPIVVGSSMGGFYGQYLATQFVFRHLFLVNPALEPWDLLAERVGQWTTTASGERYLLSAELADATRRYRVPKPCSANHAPTTLFLDAGDEIIDYRTAARLYQSCGRVIVYPGGDHAFQHLDEAIAVIASSCSEQPGSHRQP